jgi:hypothetical protein
MQKFTVTAPSGVPFEVIRAALVALDAGIDVKPSVKRARMTASASDNTPEYVGQSDMEYRRYCPKDTEGAVYCPQSERWYIPEVMDGVSVQKAINKIMAEVRKGQNTDGRDKSVYPPLYNGLPLETDSYIRRFCGSLHHVSAEYVCGVTA